MAAPTGKPSKTSPRGRLDKPIFARTSVLCNGQIAWKVGGENDMEFSLTDPQRADLNPITDVTEDLNALNGLQLQRAKPLAPLELKQPLRHVQSSLPKAVKSRIYTGDLYGSAEDLFSCPFLEFETKVRRVFGNEVRADGTLNYNDFFRRLRRSEWLLWDVEAEKGTWVAVVAHLHKKPIRNPNRKKFADRADVPATIPSPDFNQINEWCVVSAQRSLQGNAAAQRVKERLSHVLKQGKIRLDPGSEVQPGIWVPMDDLKWSSGLYVYTLIKTLMHRITEFYCRQVPYDKSFWGPLPGWMNLDEVRAEMQGRAAQRCMAATGYRSRIAIEGVRRWIGGKEVVRANELRPRQRDNIAYRTGVVGPDGLCIPVGSPTLPNDDDNQDDFRDEDVDNRQDSYQRQTAENYEYEDDDEDDEIDIHGGPIGAPPSYVYGWNPAEDSADDVPPIRHVPLAKMARLKELGIKLMKDGAVKYAKRLSPITASSTNDTIPQTNTPAAKSPGEKDDRKEGTNLKRKAEESHIATDIQEAGGIDALLRKRLKELESGEREVGSVGGP